MTPPLPFFVYGTLLTGGRYHHAFLHGRTRRTRPALLPGAVLYAGPGYPYAVEEPPGTRAPRPAVHGELVDPHPEVYAQLLLALDELEEYDPGAPEAGLYVRVERDTLLGDGTRVPARVYLAAPAVAARLRAHGELIADGDWRAYARTAPPPP